MSYQQARRIIVAGDWHGNGDWAEAVIGCAPHWLSGEDTRIILQLGDFGIWPGAAGRGYLARVSAALSRARAVLWFVDGNHEAFPLLSGRAVQRGTEQEAPGSAAISPSVYWLMRGTRWLWHGREWLALGGAVSLDRAVRTEGSDWWPEEEITGEQERAVIDAGHADVLVSHDCPSGVTHSFPPPPSFWDLRDMARSDAHRERLQRVVDGVQPSDVMHGHLHRGYQRTTDFGYGPVQVTGLDCDGGARNYALLDVKTMEWASPQAALVTGPSGR
jgi:hypothetical protein